MSPRRGGQICADAHLLAVLPMIEPTAPDLSSSPVPELDGIGFAQAAAATKAIAETITTVGNGSIELVDTRSNKRSARSR